MKVKINNKEYELHYSMRIFLYYEAMVGKSLDTNNVASYQALINLFYATVLATLAYNRENTDYGMQDFFDYIDDNGGMKLVMDFSEWFAKNVNVNNDVLASYQSEEKAEEVETKKNEE